VDPLALLGRWGNFYVIVGSSAGALTGLQFVVMGLISDAQATTSMTVIRAFGSPTLVHFCAALAISAMMCTPWTAIWQLSVSLGVFCLAGVIYSLTVLRHARKQTDYRPEFSDWMWFVVWPMLSHAALAAMAALMLSHVQIALFGVGAVTLFVLSIGIHNAWDTVTYVAIARRQKGAEEQ